MINTLAFLLLCFPFPFRVKTSLIGETAAKAGIIWPIHYETGVQYNMSEQTNEQHQQIHKVLDSLISATNLLVKLLEEEALKPSVDLFITIIEGMESIFKILPLVQEDVSAEMAVLEKSLHTIGQALETKNITNALAAVADVQEALSAVKQKLEA